MSLGESEHERGWGLNPLGEASGGSSSASKTSRADPGEVGGGVGVGAEVGEVAEALKGVVRCQDAIPRRNDERKVVAGECLRGRGWRLAR